MADSERRKEAQGVVVEKRRCPARSMKRCESFYRGARGLGLSAASGGANRRARRLERGCVRDRRRRRLLVEGWKRDKRHKRVFDDEESVFFNAAEEERTRACLLSSSFLFLLLSSFFFFSSSPSSSSSFFFFSSSSSSSSFSARATGIEREIVEYHFVFSCTQVVSHSPLSLSL